MYALVERNDAEFAERVEHAVWVRVEWVQWTGRQCGVHDWTCGRRWREEKREEEREQ